MVVSIVVLGAVRRITGKLSWGKLIFGVLGVLVVCTAVFDSIIVASEIVAYDSEKILGWYIGAAPIEDFFYAVIAAFIIPALWAYSRRRYAGK